MFFINKKNKKKINFEKNIKIKYSFKKRKTIKIINFLIEQKIKNLLFYTDINNILRQLEFGLQPIKNIKLLKNEEYIVWTYLEKENYLEFELDNSTRHYFWNWISEQKVEINNIAVIALDWKKIYKITKNNWSFDYSMRRVKIFEDISSKCINWILIKNNIYIDRIKNYIENSNLKIKVFHGEKGNIINIK